MSLKILRTSILLIIGCIQIISPQGISSQQEEPILRFGLMADVQYADLDSKKSRNYRLSLNKLKECIETFNASDLDFVVNLGDFIEKDYKSYDTLLAITKNLKAPLYQVLGNHDFDVSETDKLKIDSTLGLSSPYYQFNRKNFRFIFLNGTDISIIGNPMGSKEYSKAEDYIHQLKKSKQKGAKTWNGTLGKKQKRWLRNSLKGAKKNNERAIIFCHYPLYPLISPQVLWEANKIRNLIESYDSSTIYFNGHVHKNEHFRNNNVHYISINGMVEGEQNSYAIVSLYKDYVRLDGFGNQDTLKLYYHER